MVKHIILWQLKEDIEDKESVKKGIKENLESLVGKVPGLLKVNVVIDGLGSSNADVMLDCELDSEESLKGYQKHPAHVAVADNLCKTVHGGKMCMDYDLTVADKQSVNHEYLPCCKSYRQSDDGAACNH